MAPAVPKFDRLPVEIIRAVSRRLLDLDIPAPGARGLLFQNSFIEALRMWRPRQLSPGTLCTPVLCCNTRRGARSGQTMICFADDTGPARSSLDLLAVCKSIRDVVLGDALFWGQALLLQPRRLDTALDRALSIAQPQLSFTALGGSCLCVLDFLLENMEYVQRIDMALPSTTEDDDDSPSRLIYEEINMNGAPEREFVDLRFDWAHAHADATQKSIVRLAKVQSCRLMNSTFVIIGGNMTSLFMAAEETVFRWRRSDIYAVLHRCPNLETVALQMIFVDMDLVSDHQLIVHGVTGTVVLPRLSYFHLSDKLLEWTHASAGIVHPSDARIHGEVILPMSQIPVYSLAEFQLHCNAAMTMRNLLNVGKHHTTMALRFRSSMRKTASWKWPEYISLSFGDNVQSAMAFRDPVDQLGAGSFTVRNAALSLTSVETPWLHQMAGGLTVTSALDTFLRGCSQLGIRHVETFVVDSSSLHECPEHWTEILAHMPALRRIVLYGIESFSSHHLLELARALTTTYHILDEEEGQVPIAFPCEKLEVIHVQDAKDAVPQAGIAILNATLKRRYKENRPKINWTR